MKIISFLKNIFGSKGFDKNNLVSSASSNDKKAYPPNSLKVKKKEVVTRIVYENEPLVKLLKYSNCNIVVHGDIYHLVYSDNKNKQLLKRSFNTDSIMKYLINKLNFEREEFEESKKSPIQKLFEKLKLSPDFLEKRGYDYRYDGCHLTITRRECGSYLDISYGNQLSTKESDTRTIDIFGQCRSFDETFVIGEGFYIYGRMDDRRYDEVDEYKYFFGESIDITIESLLTSLYGECSFPTRKNGKSMNSRAYNPWRDRHGKLEYYNDYVNIQPDRTPI